MLDKAIIGVSPSGKATDSDSVIPKVRIFLPLPNNKRPRGVFCLGCEINDRTDKRQKTAIREYCVVKALQMAIFQYISNFLISCNSFVFNRYTQLNYYNVHLQCVVLFVSNKDFIFVV